MDWLNTEEDLHSLTWLESVDIFQIFLGLYLSACVGDFPVKEACPCFLLGTGSSLFPSGVCLHRTGVCPALCVARLSLGSQWPPAWHLDSATTAAGASSPARHKQSPGSPERPGCAMRAPLSLSFLREQLGVETFSCDYTIRHWAWGGPRVGKCNKLSYLLWWGFYWLCAHLGLATSSGFSQRQFSKIYLFLNWRIIALQNSVVFCPTSTWIGHKGNWICVLLLAFL